MRSPARRSMTCCPNSRRQRRPWLCRVLLEQADDIAVRRFGVHAQKQVRRREAGKAEAHCTYRPKCSNSRSMTAVSGICTAMIASQALTDARRWLIGHRRAP